MPIVEYKGQDRMRIIPSPAEIRQAWKEISKIRERKRTSVLSMTSSVRMDPMSIPDWGGIEYRVRKSWKYNTNAKHGFQRHQRRVENTPNMKRRVL